MSAPLLLAAAVAAAPAPSSAAPAAPERLLTLGSAVTETVAALGLADRIVAVDTTSRWPESLATRPRVGYLRTLSGEGLLSLRPTRVLASAEAGPAAALDALAAAGVPVVRIPEARTWPEAQARLRAVGEALGQRAEVEALVAAQDRRLAALARRLEGRERPRVLFVFAHGRSPMVGGRGSIGDTLIALGGGQLALPSLEGFKPPTAEAIAASAPAVVLTTERVLGALGGAEGLSVLPGLAATPAIREGRVVVMDEALLLTLGPRTAEAAEALARALHPSLGGA